MPSWKKVVASGSDASFSSLTVDTYVSASSFKGSFTGSLEGTASQAISSSYALTASYALFAANGGGGGISAIYIANAGITQGTASYFDFTGAGVTATVSNNTASINVTGGGGGGGTNSGQTTNFTQSVAATTWTFVHNLNTRTPLVQVYDTSYNQIVPQYISSSNANTILINFGIATAGYAVASTGGTIIVTGSNVILNQTSPATTWSFEHNLNYQYPVFQIYGSTDEVIIPQRIVATDLTSSLIYFPTPVSGKAVATVGGFSGSAGAGVGFPYSGSAVITGSFLVSQSFVDFSNASYVTGSFTGSLYGSASFATSASYAATSSYATNFTASNILVSGTITAQTLVVNTISSSIVYSSGSNIFGNSTANTQTFTGSVNITGSLNLYGNQNISGSLNVSESITASIVSATSDGLGTNFKVGNDVWIGDVNLPNTMQVAGQQDPTQGFLKFSSGSQNFTVGADSNKSFAGIDLNMTGSISVATIGSTWHFAKDVYNSTYIVFPNSSSIQNDTYLLNAGGVALADSTRGQFVIADNDRVQITVNFPSASYPEWTFTKTGAISLPRQGIIYNQQNPAKQLVFDTGSNLRVPVNLYVSSSLITNSIYGSGGFINVSGSTIISGSLTITGSISVSGSAVNSLTASQAISSSYALTASYATFALSASFAPGFTTNMSQSNAATTWSFTHNLNTINPIVQVYDLTNSQIIPNQIVGMNNSTAEIRFDYAQAGYAVASNGGGLYVTGSTSTLVQTVGAVTWSFTHNLNNKYNTYEVYDNNDYVLIPSAIKAIDNNSAELYFAGPQTGRAVAQFSGINGAPNATTASYAVSASFATNAVSASYLNPITNSYVVLTQVSQSLNFVDDAAAEAGGVPLGGIYRNGNFILIRLS